MKLRAIIVVLLVAVLFMACEKNTVSKIPHIAFTAQGLYPLDSMRGGLDTGFLLFSMVDGDGDIGYSDPGDPGPSKIYIKDSRFDTGYVPYPFPPIDVTVEDPKKGIQGNDTVLLAAVPREDSLHQKTGYDTLTYEVYIKDRAGNESNHLVTHRLILTP